MDSRLKAARNPARMFRREVPKKFLRDLLRCLFGCYAEACGKCADFPEAEAHDLLPYERRAHIEAALRDLAQRYKGMKATAQHNRVRNWSHTEIESGRVILTESSVASPGEVVRHAEFRKTYARYNQLSLLEESVPPAGARLYAILIHGPSTDPRQPLFAKIVFPGPDCEKYIEGNSIDLFVLFKDEVAQKRRRLESSARPKIATKPEVA